MIGTLLGNRYELLEKIGEGGMAEVYKAKCHLLNRFVSVKILKEEYTKDKDFVDKFKREATAAASFSDNNIVNIYDVGSQGNINYIVMEYVKGKTLKEIIIENGKLDYQRALDMAIQIAKALECAHKNNIVHRDIKPQNILVTEDGTVKVTDFGIAKASSSVTITNSSKVMGSAHYFSPEQAKGSFVDGRTDIYSLGIVMYEMVAGRVPYDAESPVSVALKHIQEPVVPPKQLNGNIPDSMNSLILKAIEKEPIRRYQTVKDMLMDLHRIKNNSNCIISKDSEQDEHTRIMQPVSAEDLDDDEYDDEVEEGNSRVSKKTKRILIGGLIVILVVAVGIIGGVLLSKAKNNPTTSAANKEVTIPTIKNMTEADAKKALEDKGLKYVLGGKEYGSQPAGTVIAVSPDEGTSVKANSEVRVVLSNGPKKSKVPPVKELDISQARDMITSSGYKVGKEDPKFSDTIPKNCVIDQDPQGDSEAAEGTTINLVVSKGPEINYSKVPTITNKSLEEAKALLNAANLKMGNPTPVDTTDPNLNNIVKTQSIEPGASKIKEQTPVDVTYYVYKAPVKINVPDFVKNKVKLQDAINQLKALGFTDADIVTTGKPDYIVISQNPPAGQVDKGTKITLQAQEPEPTPPEKPKEKQ